MYGKEAYMHLHICDSEKRMGGYDSELIQKSIDVYFSTFDLQNLYCDPCAENPAPNNTLEKIGFSFLETC